MKENFENALEWVLVHEGGYVDHPKDPGGATNKGVTLATFQRFYGKQMGKEDLKGISGEQIKHIYKTGYWDKCRCDDLPEGVDYVVFDQAVNSGPGRSAKWLQKAVGVPQDGGIGPVTLGAAGQCSPPRAVGDMCDERLGFMRRIGNGELWETFGRGWQRRVDGVRAHGLALATLFGAQVFGDELEGVSILQHGRFTYLFGAQVFGDVMEGVSIFPHGRFTYLFGAQKFWDELDAISIFPHGRFTYLFGAQVFWDELEGVSILQHGRFTYLLGAQVFGDIL